MNILYEKVSVIIPTFNRSAFIASAVESALSQEYENFEVIVVDDGSTDKTREILDKIHDRRLKVIYQPNKGRSAARNVALSVATGRFIAFLDSDDLFLPGKLSKQVDFLRNHSKYAMVYTDSICIDEQGYPIDGVRYEATVSGKIYGHVAFFRPVTITLPTVMIRREALDSLGYFDEKMSRFEDTDLWRRVSKKFLIGAINEETVKVRTHSNNSLSSQSAFGIVNSIKYYIDKIDREDFDIPLLIRRAGASRLCKYYSDAFYTEEEFYESAKELEKMSHDLFFPKVSIIIPVYNGGDFLAEAIESALAQTYKNIEIIVVNDGSSDNGLTKEISKSYNKRIHYFEKSNGGVATALNFAIDRMSGDYFSWLSHDDLYEPNKIECQVRELSNQTDPERCILYSNYTVFSNKIDDGYQVSVGNWPPEFFRLFLTEENVLHGCTLLVPRKAFVEHGRFNPDLRTTQDYDLWFRMAKNHQFLHQPLVLVRARSHANQGTLMIPDVVRRECDELLAGFVRELSEEELLATGAADIGEAYHLLAENLRDRGFEQAGSYASTCAAQQGCTSVRLSTRKVIMLKAELKTLNAQLQALEAEASGLRDLVSSIYGSRSWRLTGPFRFLWRLFARFDRR